MEYQNIKENLRENKVKYSLIALLGLSLLWGGYNTLNQAEWLSEKMCEYRNNERVTQIREGAKRAKKDISTRVKKLRGQIRH